LNPNDFFAGRYKGKVIQVDSSRSGAEEEEMIRRLLAVESYDEPTEIVIHVNMLKEGWDVTNLYTIVPLRAANARTLIEQSIGRGLRLPYGRKTGVDVVDRLNIIAHDKFQEVIDEAGRGDSPIRMQALVLTPDTGSGSSLKSISVQPTANAMLGNLQKAQRKSLALPATARSMERRLRRWFCIPAKSGRLRKSPWTLSPKSAARSDRGCPLCQAAPR
jgi:superfamily II DNA or RNA helicase